MLGVGSRSVKLTGSWIDRLFMRCCEPVLFGWARSVDPVRVDCAAPAVISRVQVSVLWFG